MVVVVVNTSMAPHKCGDTCPNLAKKGPKIKCCKCKEVCYLQCHDFEAGESISGQDTVKLTTPNGVVISTFLSTMAFSCCANIMSPKEQKSALKMPSVARGTSKSKPNDDQVYANELKGIKDTLTLLLNATNENTAEIAAIKSLSTETEATVKKVSERNATLPQSPSMTYVQAFKARAYANAAGISPGAKKRKLRDDDQSKPKFPEPKVGIKSDVNGLTIVPRLNRVRDEKPVYAKALYVSGLGPATSGDEIVKYIVENTSVKDATKFRVHKMVKKDADLSQLRFVSFKVEMNADELEILDNVELWPQGVRVREFTVLPKNELGNHFPKLPNTQTSSNATSSAPIDLTSDQMEIAP